MEARTDLGEVLDDLGNLALLAPPSSIPLPARSVGREEVLVQRSVVDLDGPAGSAERAEL